MRVANLDMADPTQNCPAGFQLINRTSPPLHTCGRPGPAGCVSMAFQTYGVDYSNVCGRVSDYQHQSSDAFHRSNIDLTYVDGISLTHGQSLPNTIWTIAGTIHETSTGSGVCPCTQSDIYYTGPNTVSFVGQDYF